MSGDRWDELTVGQRVHKRHAIQQEEKDDDEIINAFKSHSEGAGKSFTLEEQTPDTNPSEDKEWKGHSPCAVTLMFLVLAMVCIAVGGWHIMHQ